MSGISVADRRICCFGQKDILVPCQSAMEKTRFRNQEGLLEGFLAAGVTMIENYAWAMLWEPSDSPDNWTFLEGQA